MYNKKASILYILYTTNMNYIKWLLIVLFVFLLMNWWNAVHGYEAPQVNPSAVQDLLQYDDFMSKYIACNQTNTYVHFSNSSLVTSLLWIESNGMLSRNVTCDNGTTLLMFTYDEYGYWAEVKTDLLYNL